MATFESFRPKLKPGNILPQGSKVIYETHGSFKEVGDISEDADDAIAMEVLTEKIKSEISAAGFEAAAISAAMDFETRAVNVYKSRALETDDANEKELYNMLAKWEGSHQRFLHNINESLKHEIWFDNHFWPH